MVNCDTMSSDCDETMLSVHMVDCDDSEYIIVSTLDGFITNGNTSTDSVDMNSSSGFTTTHAAAIADTDADADAEDVVIDVDVDAKSESVADSETDAAAAAATAVVVAGVDAESGVDAGPDAAVAAAAATVGANVVSTTTAAPSTVIASEPTPLDTFKFELLSPSPATYESDIGRQLAAAWKEAGFYDPTSLVFEWPLRRKLTSTEVYTISGLVDTINIVCEEVFKLTLHQPEFNEMNPSFEDFSDLVQRFNEQVVSLRKRPSTSGRIEKSQEGHKASRNLLQRIMTQIYNSAITNPLSLNRYKSNTPAVYGEFNFDLVDTIIKTRVPLGPEHRFVDLGSGVGQVVLQVAATCFCSESFGIERENIPYNFSVKLQEEFRKVMAYHGKLYGKFRIMQGDFLNVDHLPNDMLRGSKLLLLANNLKFGTETNHGLDLRFSDFLEDGAAIVSTSNLVSKRRTISKRTQCDLASHLRMESFMSMEGGVSWTGAPVEYYVQIKDASLLQEFLNNGQNPLLLASKKKDQINPLEELSPEVPSKGQELVDRLNMCWQELEMERAKVQERQREIAECKNARLSHFRQFLSTHSYSQKDVFLDRIMKDVEIMRPEAKLIAYRFFADL